MTAASSQQPRQGGPSDRVQGLGQTIGQWFRGRAGRCSHFGEGQSGTVTSHCLDALVRERELCSQEGSSSLLGGREVRRGRKLDCFFLHHLLLLSPFCLLLLLAARKQKWFMLASCSMLAVWSLLLHICWLAARSLLLHACSLLGNAAPRSLALSVFRFLGLISLTILN